MARRRIFEISSAKMAPGILGRCRLCISVGLRDVQVAVLEGRKECHLLESHVLGDVRTLRGRMDAVQALFDEHLYLKAGYWAKVSVSFKSHKFALIPRAYYDPKTAPHYLSMNSFLRLEQEGIYAHYSPKGDFVNVFATEKKMVLWIRSLYPKLKPLITHQATPFVRGAIFSQGKQKNHALYALLDGRILHLTLLRGGKLLFYNQFAIRSKHDMIKYTTLVLREWKVPEKQTPFILFGDFSPPQLSAIRSHFPRARPGDRRKLLHFSYHFDEIPEHKYFDVLSFSLF
ncbi:MAG: DUF3822 family protein [Cytophagales bacterium]|nr:DUF3822 family protein [Cytophagales bacterium]